MAYFVLANQFNGELILVSQEPLLQGEGQLVKRREGDIPDLTRYEWHNGSLAFIEKNKSRVLTRLAFMRRFTAQELASIYSIAKTNIQLEIWLDKFKLAEEINLDDVEIVEGLSSFEALGILVPGRAQEILA